VQGLGLVSLQRRDREECVLLGLKCAWWQAWRQGWQSPGAGQVPLGALRFSRCLPPSQLSRMLHTCPPLAFVHPGAAADASAARWGGR